MVDGLALLGIGGLAVDFEQLLDLVEERLLLGIVLGAELLGALEHQVFEIVGEAGGLLRVVLAADLDGHVGVDARFVLVDDHVDFKAVVEGVDPRCGGIALDGLVLVLAAAGQGKDEDGCQHEVEDTFHNGWLDLCNFGAKVIKQMVSLHK